MEQKKFQKKQADRTERTNCQELTEKQSENQFEIGNSSEDLTLSEKTGISVRSLSVMRNHKDTVFRKLFGDKKALLSLYNALNGTDYTDEDVLEIETLEHAIYIGVSDDAAFLPDARLNIYEQQASFNPNMPLRDLLYIAAHYSGFLEDESIYSTRLVRIPVPQFVVFYNGTQKQPERRILKLSDAYAKETQDPQLELKVLMLNINQGYNRELLEKCRTLQEYCIFVETIRKYAKGNEIEEAVNMAVDECIKNNVLREFLTAQRSEVIQMSIFEFDIEKEIKKLRKSEFNYGKDVGHEEGLEEGKSLGREEGLAAGAAGILRICQESGFSRQEALKKLICTMQLDEEKAAEYINRYWNKA